MSQTRDHATAHAGTDGNTDGHGSKGSHGTHASQGRTDEPYSRSRTRSHTHSAARGSRNAAHVRRVVSIPDRARAYLARMPVSVQGQGGHLAAFKAASTLVNGFALGVEEALPLLLAWNAQCLPPWREADLRYKLRSAASHPGTRARGYLLDHDRPSSSGSASFSSSSSYSSSSSRPHRLRQGGQPASAATEAETPAQAAAATNRNPLPAASTHSHPAADAHGRNAYAAPACADQETVLRGTRKTACGTQALHPSPPSTSACETQALRPITAAPPQESSACVPHAASGIAQDTTSRGTQKTANDTPKTACETLALRPTTAAPPQESSACVSPIVFGREDA